MKINRYLIISLGLLASTTSPLAQEAIEVVPTEPPYFDMGMWFRILEVPFLLMCVMFAFLTASALKGGNFGRGMALIAWGFFIMGMGHLHLQIKHFYNINIFAEIFGKQGGDLVWVLALVITWTLSLLGFYRIYKSSKGE